MQTMTVEQLEDAVRKVDSFAAKQGEHMDLASLVFAGCCLPILSHFLGDSWVRKNLIEKDRPGPDYFRAHPASQERHKFGLRTLAFAEMLFNLQHLEGFEARLPALNAGGVESGVVELQGIALLYSAGLHVHLREHGYELDVVLPDQAVAVELKCKLESTDLSYNTILGTLNQARSQLPRDQAGAIMVNIPEDWTITPSVGETIRAVLDEFFRNTGRVSLVVFWWEQWLRQGRGWLRTFHGRPELNPNARKDAGPITNLISLTHTASPAWVYLDAVVRDTLGRDDGTIVRPR